MTTQQMIDKFEERIKELLKKGYTAKRAVEIAYKEYPIMEQVLSDLEVSLHAEFERGYGGTLPTSVTAKALSLSWTPDKLTLSDRTTMGSATVQSMVADVIYRQMRTNESYKQLALAIFDGYGKDGIIPVQEVPQYINALYRLSNGKGYDEVAFNKAIQRVRKSINKRTTAGLKAAYHQLINAIETRNDEMLSKAVYVATQERTRYFAERIARTEKARAYHDGFIAKYNDDDDIVAYQWKLSSRHPVDDICDLYANADLYGMGKGIFPKDKVPLLPVHPNCMCHLKPIVKGSLKNEVPKERIEEGGREYLDGITNHKRKRLLGVHGAKAVEEGTSWTQKARGYNTKNFESRIENVKIKEKDYKIVDAEKIKDLQRQSDEVYNKLNKEEREALSEYTQGGYIPINSSLAAEEKSFYEKGLNDAINKFILKDDIITYRGTNEKYYKTYKVGDVFEGKVFYSTSLDYEQAKAFADDATEYDEDGYKGVLLEIKVPKNSKALYVGGNTDYKDGNYTVNERELLLSNKVKYKIEKIEKDKIVLEVMKDE